MDTDQNGACQHPLLGSLQEQTLVVVDTDQNGACQHPLWASLQEAHPCLQVPSPQGLDQIAFWQAPACSAPETAVRLIVKGTAEHDQ